MKVFSIRWSSARNVRLAILATTAVMLYTVTLTWSGGRILGSYPARSRGTWIGTEHMKHEAADAHGRAEAGPAPVDFGRVANRTLGFEMVMAVGLPERSDKRDALDLMAALSGFDIDWVDGVKPSSIPDKAVPFGIDMAKVHDNFLGSWRGHMNAIRRIVETGCSSALIMEDDMDWDMHLKAQLGDIARGTRRLLGETSPLPHSPYGDTWDVLWLGHCGEPFPETLEENSGLQGDARARMSAKYIISGDGTVPPYSKLSPLVDWSDYPPHTRLVHISAAPICSFAYAVSQAAARRILYALSVDGLQMAFDNSLAQLCRDAVHGLARKRAGGYRLRCLSVNPTIMFHHKPKGRLAGDSDIQGHGQDGSVRDKGLTESIQWSLRLNLENLLTGQPPQPQFPDAET